MKCDYKLPKDFTVNEVSIFKDNMYQKVEEGYKEVLLDFSECSFIDSTGLGAIVSVFKRLNSIEGTLILRHMCEDIRRLFRITRLDQVMNIDE